MFKVSIFVFNFKYLFILYFLLGIVQPQFSREIYGSHQIQHITVPDISAGLSYVRDTIVDEFLNHVDDDNYYVQVADIVEDLGFCKKEGW